MKNFEAGFTSRFRIYASANDIELHGFLQLVNKHVTIFCEPIEVCTDKYTSVPLRKITFAVPSSSNLTCAIVTKWLISLNVIGGQVVRDELEK